MSNVSNRHNILPFVAGKSTALTGQRLAKVGYKETKKNTPKFKSVCASVPFLKDEEITENMNRLLPHVKVMMEEAQDKIVRSLYESSEGNLTSVSDEEISVSAILSFLESESAGGRLTKEMIQNWFKEELEDNLTVYVAEKLNYTDPSEGQLKEIGQHVNGYREVFASLAGGATVLHEKQIKGCKVALGLVSDPDKDIAVKLSKRLENMEKPIVVKELLEL